MSFNPRSHTGSDVLVPISAYAISMFQSTLPHGERLSFVSTHVSLGLFQSTLPHGERPRLLPMVIILICFNPRSHTGSDIIYSLSCLCSDGVSIHAPTRGATWRLPTVDCETLFQSTLPHGERLSVSTTILVTSQFQSTLPHGERLVKTSVGVKRQKFQSTLPHGERLLAKLLKFNADRFQSTLPHGERLK